MRTSNSLYLPFDFYGVGTRGWGWGEGEARLDVFGHGNR